MWGSIRTDTGTSEMDSVFGDAEDTDRSGPFVRGGRKRQSSVPEMMHALEEGQKRQKRSKRSSKEKDATEKGEHSCRLDGSSLEAVKSIVNQGIDKMTKLMEENFKRMERRIEILEGELFLKDAETKALQNKVSAQEATIQSLTEQLEGIDTNRRMNSLILKTEEFGKREREEDIEGKVISILNQRFPDVHVTPQDIQTTHRLQGDSTVIVKFAKTKLKEEIYERRMNQAKVQNRGDRLVAPLYVNESLSAKNKAIFGALLEAKRRKKIYTVYTRRGAVFCKLDRESAGRRIGGIDEATSLLDGAARAADWRPAAAGRAVGTPAPAAAAGVSAPDTDGGNGGVGDRGRPAGGAVSAASGSGGRRAGGDRPAPAPSGGAAEAGRS